MIPVQGQPGVFQILDQDGKTAGVINIRKWYRFETSIELHLGSESFFFDTSKLHQVVLDNWRFTCQVWPEGSGSQQQVNLYVNGIRRASATLSSLLTLANPLSQDQVLIGHNRIPGVARVGFDRLLFHEKLDHTVLARRDDLVEVRLSEPSGSSWLRLHLGGYRQDSE